MREVIPGQFQKFIKIFQATLRLWYSKRNLSQRLHWRCLTKKVYMRIWKMLELWRKKLGWLLNLTIWYHHNQINSHSSNSFTKRCLMLNHYMHHENCLRILTNLKALTKVDKIIMRSWLKTPSFKHPQEKGSPKFSIKPLSNLEWISLT